MIDEITTEVDTIQEVMTDVVADMMTEEAVMTIGEAVDITIEEAGMMTEGAVMMIEGAVMMIEGEVHLGTMIGETIVELNTVEVDTEKEAKNNNLIDGGKF